MIHMLNAQEVLEPTDAYLDGVNAAD